MSIADLNVEFRDNTGHRTAKSLRRQGKIPGIFYYHNEKSIPLSLNEKEFQRLIQKEINIFNVIFSDGKNRKSIIREIQRDPVTDAIIHVDIMGIKMDEKVRLTIPILLTGTPVGVKEGGILEHLLRDVEVEGLPLDIPEHIEVDVSELMIGDVVHLEDVAVEKIKFITEIHHAVANVIQPKVVVEAVEEAVEVEEGEEGEEEKAPPTEGDEPEKNE